MPIKKRSVSKVDIKDNPLFDFDNFFISEEMDVNVNENSFEVNHETIVESREKDTTSNTPSRVLFDFPNKAQNILD